MKRSFFFAVIFSALFVACGDDSSGSGPASGEESSSSVSGETLKSSDSGEGNLIVEEDLGPVVEADSCRISGKNECEYGTLTDDRDGQEYKTVKIGKQTWMAENLNYNIENPKSVLALTPCFNERLDSCSKYGRYYTWSQAMDSAATWSSEGKNCGLSSKVCRVKAPVRGICPEGWHLPSRAEWVYLLDAIGWENSLEKLASISGWYIDKGRDRFGFDARPGHRQESHAIWGHTGTEAYFWSSTQFDEVYAFIMYLSDFDEKAYVDMDFKRYRLNVRCVQDD